MITTNLYRGIKQMLKRNVLYKSFFYASIVLTYFAGLVFYDVTTGLDFQFYFNTVSFFSDSSFEVFDPGGSLYFSLIAKFLDISLIILDNASLRTTINITIQTFNLILFIMGFFGMQRIMLTKKISKSNIYLTFSILCFFPPTLYLRLTMKPEIFAFALLPWIIYSTNQYFQSKRLHHLILSSFLISLILTSKASITGMVLLVLAILYFDKLKQDKMRLLRVSLLGTFTSLAILYENYKIFNIWLFEKNLNIKNFEYASSFSDWDYRAPTSFFYSIDFRNLYENPFKFLHSDSFISITLLDTLSDYFGFFWNHKEITNLIAFNRVEFTENFLIQNFLPMYISILFTTVFYFLSIYIIIFKLDNWKFIAFPFAGIFILALSSLGFPSNNFNPNTGDTFKVHYYSFLLIVSFVFLISTIIKKLNKIDFLTLLLIPVFLICMGFPKNIDQQYSLNLENKFNTVFICNTTNYDNIECNYEEPELKGIKLDKNKFTTRTPIFSYIILGSALFLIFRTKEYK